MKKILFALFLFSSNFLSGQEMVDYFKRDDHLHLEPGDEIMKKSVLITNQDERVSVSFRIGYSINNTSNRTPYALDAKYSGIVKIAPKEKCYIFYNYRDSKGLEISKCFTLLRGKCYSFVWEKQSLKVNENDCKRK